MGVDSDYRFCRLIAARFRRRLSQDASVETEFEFTESEATIHFKRLDDSISISASYAPSTAQISLTEFTNAVARFSAKVADELPQRYPSLLKNQAFVEIFKKTVDC